MPMIFRLLSGLAKAPGPGNALAAVPPTVVFMKSRRLISRLFVSSSLRALESEAGAHLDDPRSSGAQELAEKTVVTVRSQAGKIGVIERVEHVRADLHLNTLSDRDVFCKAQVQIPQARFPKRPGTSVAGPERR